MPIYEYGCPNGHIFDSVNTIDNRHKTTCPICNGEASLRISKASIRFAQPIRWIDSDGNQIAWKPDSGISPPIGQPYPMGG